MSDDDKRTLLQSIVQRLDSRRSASTRIIGGEGMFERSVAGEFAFSQRYGIALDPKLVWKGDNGIDFWMPMLVGVDVKTAQQHDDRLFVEQGKVRADIYVLANDTGDILNAQLSGWAWSDEVLRVPARDHGKGIVSHMLRADVLHKMHELDQRLAVVGCKA